MRLDNVLLRLRDTRVYVDFETSEVIREYQSRECDYEAVRQAGQDMAPNSEQQLTSCYRNSLMRGMIFLPS
jgi:type 2A phosphatase activator TIP41